MPDICWWRIQTVVSLGTGDIVREIHSYGSDFSLTFDMACRWETSHSPFLSGIGIDQNRDSVSSVIMYNDWSDSSSKYILLLLLVIMILTTMTISTGWEWTHQVKSFLTWFNLIARSRQYMSGIVCFSLEVGENWCGLVHLCAKIISTTDHKSSDVPTTLIANESLPGRFGPVHIHID